MNVNAKIVAAGNLAIMTSRARKPDAHTQEDRTRHDVDGVRIAVRKRR
ncbi:MULTISPECIES: hypothetical protein [unclassified Caballeronia]|nr:MULTISPECIES: hypothetical protein [unclassified Caballeronia]